MSVGILFNKPGVFKEYKEAVSGHIQLPMKSYSLLHGQGITTKIITTKVPGNQTLPSSFDSVDLNDLTFITDPNRQKQTSVVKDGHIKGVVFIGLLRFIWDLYKVILKNRIKTLFVFGTPKFAAFSGLIKIINPCVKLVWVTEFYSRPPSKLLDVLINMTFKEIFSTTKFVKASSTMRSKIQYLPKGNVRDLTLMESLTKERVLFWRDPSYENGADITLRIFEKIAPQFPQIKFTFAVRPHWDSLIPENCDHGNIEIFHFPYTHPITLERLLSESICVCSPYRELSVNPQLALVETLMAGLPVVSSNVESCKEYLEVANQNATLEDDVDEYVAAIKKILDDHISGKGSVNLPDVDALKAEYCWDKYMRGISSVI